MTMDVDSPPPAQAQGPKEIDHPLYLRAQGLAASKDPLSAVPVLREILLLQPPAQPLVPAPEGAPQEEDTAAELARVKEAAIYRIGEIFAKLRFVDELRKLLVDIRPFFASIPKARTAKIVRTLIDLVGNIPESTTIQIQLCKESIEWCKLEKRTFLKQRIESKLASLLLEVKDFKAALKLISVLLKEVKKMDDKLLLVEIDLVESKIHMALQNIPKSKAALTGARAASNAIYCPPLLQAQIDEQAGTLCTLEKDYKTAFSYFFEAFEAYSTINDPKNAVKSMKYMLLTKIMTNSPGDVFSLISGKSGLKYAGVELDAMKAIAEAYKKRSLHTFKEVLGKYKVQLQDDPLIGSQLTNLYENLLEQNLIRIIEPFSRVQISRVAELIDLPLPVVLNKLSEMILDRKFHGILDQGAGDLIIYDEILPDATYEASLNTVKELGVVVDRLYDKARRLAAPAGSISPAPVDTGSKDKDEKKKSEKH